MNSVRGSLAPPAPLRVRATQGTKGRATRCTVCHDGLGAGARLTCSTCGATLHAECRKLVARCPTLGCPGLERGAPKSARPRRARRPRRRLALAVLGVLLALGASGAVGLLVRHRLRTHTVDGAGAAPVTVPTRPEPTRASSPPGALQPVPELPLLNGAPRTWGPDPAAAQLFERARPARSALTAPAGAGSQR